MLKAKLDQDIKNSLLAGDKTRATVLRNLKSAILYAEVAANQREAGLDDKAVLEVLAKESKKRQESADLYIKGGDQNRAKAEMDEKAMIDEYLPTQLSDQELSQLVEKVCVDQPEVSLQAMGKIIADVKKQADGRADGARIANAVKERLQ